MNVIAIALSAAGCVLVFGVGYSLIPLTPEIVEILAPARNRELGVIETTQHLILVVLSIIHFHRGRTQPNAAPMRFIVAAACAFLFLEETDFLMTYADEIIVGRSHVSDIAGFRNFHNIESIWVAPFIGRLVLAVATTIVGVRSAWGSERLLKVFHMSKFAGTISALVITLIILAIPLRRIPLEDNRQLASESGELALYTSWIVLASGWPPRRKR